MERYLFTLLLCGINLFSFATKKLKTMKKNLFITLMLVLLALPLASCGNDEPPFGADMIDGPEGVYMATVIIPDDNGYVRVRIEETPEEVQKKFEEIGTSLLFPVINDGLRFKKENFNGHKITEGQMMKFVLLKVKRDELPMIDYFMVHHWVGIVEPVN